MAKQKAMFLLRLSYPVVMMILVISGFSLVVSFYMGIMPAKEGGDSNVCGGMAIPGLALPAIP